MIRNDFWRRAAVFFVGTGLATLLVAAALLWQFDQLLLQRDATDLFERTTRRADLFAGVSALLPANPLADLTGNIGQLLRLAAVRGLKLTPFHPTEQTAIGWVDEGRFAYRLIADDPSTPSATIVLHSTDNAIKRALSGASGTMFWSLQEDQSALAAYAPVTGTKFAIVMVEDLSELRRPIFKFGFVAAVLSLLLTGIATFLYLRLTSPLQRRLVESSDHMLALIDATTDAVVTCDLDGRILSANPAAEKMFGHPLEHLIGQPITRLVPGLSSDVALLGSTPQNPHTRRTAQAFRANGTPFPVDLLLVRIRLASGPAVAGTFRDRTREDQQEQEQIRYRRQLQSILNAIPQRIFLKDTEGKYALVNDAFSRPLGLAPSELLGRRVQDVLPPAEAEMVERLDCDAIARGTIVDLPAVRFSGHDGGARFSHVTRIPLRNEAGDVHQLVGVIEDVTEALKAREALEAARHTLQSLIDSVPHYVFVRDLEGRYTTVNRAMRDLFSRLGRGDPLDPRHGPFYALDPNGTDRIRRVHEQVLASRQPVVVDEAIFTESGSDQVLVHLVLAPMFDLGGQIVAVACIASDITEWRHAQAEVDHMFKFSPDLQAIAGTDGYFKRVNPAFEQLVGFSAAEIMAQPLANFIHPEDQDITAESSAAFRDGNMVRYVNRYRRRDGEYRWIEWYGNMDPATHLIYRGGRDITEDRRRDQALISSEQRWRALFENVPVGIYETDRAGNSILVNERFMAITGLKFEDTKGRLWMTHVHPQDAERVGGMGRKIAESERALTTEFRFVNPEGIPVWVEATAIALRDSNGAVLSYIGALIDLTQRKRAEAAQIQSYNLMGAVSRAQSRFISETPAIEIFQQALDDLMLITQSSLGLIAVAREPGSAPDSSPDTPWISTVLRSRIAAEDEGKAEARLRSFATEALAKSTAIAFTFPPTDPLPHTYIALPVRHARQLLAVVVLAGRPEGYPEEEQRALEPVLATYGAMTEAIHNEQRRQEAEREIRVKNQQLESVFANMAEGVILLDRSGRIAQVNLLARSMLDWPEIPAHKAGDLGRLFDFYTPDGLPLPHDQLALVRCMAEGQTIIGQQAFLRRSWGEVALLVSAAPLFDESGKVSGAVGILGDITELKRMDRLKTDFIATVSHEVRTPLAAMLGYTQLLLDGDAGAISPEHRDYLEIISRNTVRLTQLINHLLDIERIESGKIKMERRSVALSDLLYDVEATFRLSAKQKGLSLVSEISPNLGVAGDSDRLIQVFSNLLSNAVKYTREGTVHLRAEQLGSEVRITVSDSGIGMTPDGLTKLFTKFYRADDEYARKAGGTGLGLVISRAIVAQHGGRIEVSSVHGKGTEFRVLLPSTGVQGGPRRAA